MGTGIYIVDIQAEISAMTKKLTYICLGILVFIFLLSGFIIWQGITVQKKRKMAEERARIQQEQLYQAGKMATVGTLAAGVAHEINNPVTAILLNTPIVKEMWHHIVPVVQKAHTENNSDSIGGMDFTELFSRIPKLLDHIEDGARRIRNIVNELKDFARLSPPEMSDDVDLNEAVKKSVGLVSSLTAKSTDHLTVYHKDDLPTFKGNAQKVEQVIINLLVNACQALSDKTQAIEIRTNYDAEQSQVSVTIRDEGMGMPPDVLARIKDPLFHHKAKRRQYGAGACHFRKNHEGSWGRYGI